MTATTTAPITAYGIARLALWSKGFGKLELADLRLRTGERVQSHLRPCGGTAAWSFDARIKAHQIQLDPNYTATIDTAGYRGRGGKHTRKSQCQYGATLVRHEKWHGLRTDRDLAAVGAYCASKGVPFEALNIGEDLRIEAIARADEGKAFGWLTWNTIPAEPGRPYSEVTEPLRWLSLATLIETPDTRRWTWRGTAKVERIVGGLPDGKGQRSAVEVLVEVCTDIASAANTRAVVDILADLFATFPTAKREPRDVGGLPSRVAGTGYTDKRGNTDTDETDRSGETRKKLDGLDPVTRAAFDHFVREGATIGDGRIDLSNVKGIADRLSALLGKLDAPPTRTSQSGSRLHVANVARGEAGAFRTSGRSGGKRKVVVICDQSGSMNSQWRSHGASFAGAMLLLAQRGIIDAKVILTGGRRYCELPKNFPVELLGITDCSEGCESVAQTMDANRAAICDAETTIVYTDGDLTDGDVVRGEWRADGVDVVGAAVSESPLGMQDRLQEHFDRGIVAPTGAAMAASLVQYIGRRPKR